MEIERKIEMGIEDEGYGRMQNGIKKNGKGMELDELE